MNGDDKPPIIALALNTWHSPWAGRQQLLSRLAARGWPVVYSNGPLTLWDRGSPRWRDAGWSGRCEHADGVLVDFPGQLAAGWPRSSYWTRWARQHHASRLAHAAGPTWSSDGILFVFHPVFMPYVDLLQPRHVIYHAFDTFSMMPGWKPEHTAMESSLVNRADLVLATSAGIARELPASGPAKAIDFPNGADTEAFLKAEHTDCPADLAEIPRPRIGYIGRISLKLDFETIAAVASARPDWHWVFVGPVFTPDDDADPSVARMRAGLETCRKLDNVHFLGSKSREELPAYMYHMDVNTICYRTEGGWWVNCYPLKLHEYLAVARPVVGSALAALQIFSNVVRIATSHGDWIDALDDALDNGGHANPDTRRAVASANTWDSRVDRLESRLLELPGLRATA